MHPDKVLEKVFKKYKGTIHDTPYWKNKIKIHINHYVKNIKKSKRSRKKSINQYQGETLSCVFFDEICISLCTYYFS